MSARVRRRLTVAGGTVTALLALILAPAPAVSLADTRLDHLRAVGPVRALALIEKSHDDTLARDWAATQAPLVHRWWAGLSELERERNIRRYPSTTGDSPGIAFSARDRANRILLARAKAKATGKDSSVATARAASLTAITSTLAVATGPRRYLISFEDGPQPLAAIALGDLDTATLATFVVPGMGTYTSDMHLWTQAAGNVYTAQGHLGATKHRSVISWMGYEPPPPGIEATKGDYARAGAPALVAAIRAVQGVRGTKAKVNVVAHSYGTTTAADALASTDLGINSFVMVGSAGIEDAIPNAPALHARHVYAGEASGDTEARGGRETRQDPRTVRFGAQIIQVDGDAATGLLAVTGHTPIIHSTWNDDPTSKAWNTAKFASYKADYLAHFGSFGYLDSGTESLHNIAAATTPGAAGELITGSDRRVLDKQTDDAKKILAKALDEQRQFDAELKKLDKLAAESK